MSESHHGLPLDPHHTVLLLQPRQAADAFLGKGIPTRPHSDGMAEEQGRFFSTHVETNSCEATKPGWEAYLQHHGARICRKPIRMPPVVCRRVHETKQTSLFGSSYLARMGWGLQVAKATSNDEAAPLVEIRGYCVLRWSLTGPGMYRHACRRQHTRLLPINGAVTGERPGPCHRGASGPGSDRHGWRGGGSQPQTQSQRAGTGRKAPQVCVARALIKDTKTVRCLRDVGGWESDQT